MPATRSPASLGDRLHGAADGVDGTGVTQAGIAAAVTGRPPIRSAPGPVAGGIAAAVVLLGAVAVAGPFRDDEPERVLRGRSDHHRAVHPDGVDAPIPPPGCGSPPTRRSSSSRSIG